MKSFFNSLKNERVPANALSHPSGSRCGPVRIHASVLLAQSTSFVTRLRTASSVPAWLDQSSADQGSTLTVAQRLSDEVLANTIISQGGNGCAKPPDRVSPYMGGSRRGQLFGLAVLHVWLLQLTCRQAASSPSACWSPTSLRKRPSRSPRPCRSGQLR